MNILPPSEDNQPLFDRIRRIDRDGNEYWLATELLSLLGYKSWKRIKDTVERGIISCQNSQKDPSCHFAEVVQMAQIGGSQAFRETLKDFELSRYACYLTAMNGDPRKPEIAQAQAYFAIKTREAEVAVPAQSDRIKDLELQLAIATQQAKANEAALKSKELDHSMLTMHGAPVVLAIRGYGDRVIEVERKTLEVLDEKTGAKFKGMTGTQLKDLLDRKYGIKYKSGAEVIRHLESKGMGDLIAQTPRRVLSDYIPEEYVDSAIAELIECDRQMLLGE